MQFNLNSIGVSKSSKSIEPEPTFNQTKSIGWDTIVNLPSFNREEYCITVICWFELNKYYIKGLK